MSLRIHLKLRAWPLYLFFSVMLIVPALCSSQMLEPGNKMPEIKVKYTESGEMKELNFSDLKGKLVILDFWNIWCSACISSMPKLDSLQKKFNSNIQIFLVTDNTQEQVSKIFKRPFLKNVDLPMIIQDSVLINYFPRQTVPHHIWIMPDGIVKYITYGDNATESNISGVLAGEYPKLSYKNEIHPFDFAKPLWSTENHFFSNHISYYSYLANWIEEYGGSGRNRLVDSTTKTITGIRVINEYLLSLYQIAYGGFDKGDFQFMNRIMFDLKDKTSMLEPKPESSILIDEWRRKNVFSYELNLPISKSKELYSVMQEDLRRYLPYSVSVQKRKVKCLALIRTTTIDKIKSKSAQPVSKNINDTIVIKKGTISNSLLRGLQIAHENSLMPVVDLTNYKGSIDIQLNCSYSNIPILRKELKKYDLDLIETIVEIEMLVIRDKNY